MGDKLQRKPGRRWMRFKWMVRLSALHVYFDDEGDRWIWDDLANLSPILMRYRGSDGRWADGYKFSNRTIWRVRGCEEEAEDA